MARQRHLLPPSVAFVLLTALPALAVPPTKRRLSAAPPQRRREGRRRSTATRQRLVTASPRRSASVSAPKSRPARGACRGIVAMVSVPLDCPEQEVKIVDEDFSPEVRDVTYRPVPGGEVKQMLISVPFLPNGATAHAIRHRRSIDPPDPAARKNRRPENPQETLARNSAVHLR